MITKNEENYSDKGCWRLLQALVLQSFEQAEQKKNAGLIYNWAVKSRKGNNMILHCYSEIGEHDYDKLVSLLEERSAKTLGITNHEINDKERNRMAGPR